MPVEQLPDGFEIHESPDTEIVSVRRIRPSRITQSEPDRLTGLATELAREAPTIVEIEADSLVVYALDATIGNARSGMNRICKAFGVNEQVVLDFLTRQARYSRAFRFTLDDETARTYSAERWCYRGGDEHWTPLLGPSCDLESLARRCLPHVGAESFYELM